MNKATLCAIGSAVLVGAVAGWLAGRTPSEPAPPAPRASTDPSQPREVLDLLGQVHRTWHPAERQRLLQSFEARGGDLVRGLDWVLNRPGHPFLLEAVLVSGAIGQGSLETRLRAHAEQGSPEVRAAAVQAAAEITPWTAAELARLIDSGENGVVAAALHSSAAGREVPVEIVMSLLAHPDARVAAAARAALAAIDPSIRIAAVRDCLADSMTSTPSTRLAIASLVGANVDAELEELLHGILDMREEPDRCAALGVLATKRTALQHPQAILKLATDANRSPRERALALSCLERTGSPADLQAVAQLAQEDSFLRYFAARLLIANGDRRGVATLLELAEAGHDATDAETANSVGYESRRILARLSRCRLQDGPRAFREWFENLRSFGRWTLDPSRIKV